MARYLLILVAAVLALAVAGLAFFWEPGPRLAPGQSPRLAQGGDFTLQSADGPVALKDFRGRVVLLYFGYTYCPDICPTELATVAAGLKRLTPEEAARVAVLFISVDPDRDTPAHLKEYAAFFHPAMRGITGPAPEVADVARRYGIFYARQKTGSAGGYVIDHTSEVCVVAPDGRLVGRISHGALPEQVAAEIRKYL